MDPKYQYYPQNHPATPVYPTPVYKPSVASQVFQAGIFGMTVVATGTLGANLHHVADGNMTLGQAAGHAAASGLTGGVAAASATAATATLTNGGVAGVAVTLATATGVSYLINKMMK